jgi:hypothetical protein
VARAHRRTPPAEDAGYDPADVLSHVAAQDQAAVRSVSEVLAWRINHHLAASDDSTDKAVREAPLLPWVPTPRQGLVDPQSEGLNTYLDDMAEVIASRIQALAENGLRLRPPWISALGQPPADPARRSEWRRHVAVAAAYRDQNKITSDDPGQPLGPFAEPGHANHVAYQHAVRAILAARNLAGAPSKGRPRYDQATAQLASDIYRSLAEEDRAAVVELVAASPEVMWSGDPLVLAAYPSELIGALIERGHLTDRSSWPEPQPAGHSEPVKPERTGRSRPRPQVVKQLDRPSSETEFTLNALRPDRDSKLIPSGRSGPLPGAGKLG